MAKTEFQQLTQEIHPHWTPLSGHEPRLEYVAWARQVLEEHYAHYGITHLPQKAEAQLILQQESLGDPDTWMIPAYDLESITNVIKALLNQGRRNIWIGTVIGNDFADPNAPPNRESANLYRGPNDKGINSIDDFYHQFSGGGKNGSIADYAKKHPELVLKIFPQDGRTLTVGRLIAAKDGLTIQLKYTGHLARESESGNGLYTFIIRHSPTYQEEMVVFCEPTDLPYLQAIINNATDFGLLEVAMSHNLPQLTLLNPEFMMRNLHEPKSAQLAFFTDCIWALTPPNNNGRQYKPIAQIITSIPQMHVLPPWAQFIERWPNFESDTTTFAMLIREAYSGNRPHVSYSSYLEEILHLLLINGTNPQEAAFLTAFTRTSKQGSYFLPGSRPQWQDQISTPRLIDQIVSTLKTAEGLQTAISRTPTVQQLLAYHS